MPPTEEPKLLQAFATNVDNEESSSKNSKKRKYRTIFETNAFSEDDNQKIKQYIDKVVKEVEKNEEIPTMFFWIVNIINNTIKAGHGELIRDLCCEINIYSHHRKAVYKCLQENFNLDNFYVDQNDIVNRYGVNKVVHNFFNSILLKC